MRELDHKLFTRRTAIVASVIFLAFAGFLYLEGRPAWCKSGLALWTSAWSHCTSQNLLDPYTMSHVLHGLLFYWLLRPLASRVSLAWRLVAALGIEVGWELVENSAWVIERYRQHTASLDYYGDSILNSLADVAAAVAGFVYASRYSWQAAVALCVVFELVMLAIARDNLTLNIVMLLWPIEAIKEWQISGMPRL